MDKTIRFHHNAVSIPTEISQSSVSHITGAVLVKRGMTENLMSIAGARREVNRKKKND